jgi:hypothetical protein
METVRSDGEVIEPLLPWLWQNVLRLAVYLLIASIVSAVLFVIPDPAFEGGDVVSLSGWSSSGPSSPLAGWFGVILPAGAGIAVRLRERSRPVAGSGLSSYQRPNRRYARYANVSRRYPSALVS